MKKIFIVLALFISSLAFATEYSGNYALPYSYDKANSFRTYEPYAKAQAIVSDSNLNSLRQYDAQGYINSVAREIKACSTDDFVRAKMAHDVTALLLYYDAANYWAGTVPDQTLSYVLRTRTAVCEGYSNVYKALCDAIGIQCQKVHGYSRGVGYSNGGYEDPTNSNHAWNIVKLEGAWYLVDCTWDSGHMNGRVSVQEYNTTWLFAKPEYFICTHFPTDDATQQLMTRQVSTSGFRSLPDFRPNINDVAELLTYPKKENFLSNGQCVISYKAKNGGHLSASIKDSSNTIISSYFSYTNNGTTDIFISFPRSGTYTITLFVYKAGSNTGISCGNFIVNSSVAGSSVANINNEQKKSLIADSRTTTFSRTQISASDTYIAKTEPSYSYTPSYSTTTRKKTTSPKSTYAKKSSSPIFSGYGGGFSMMYTVPYYQIKRTRTEDTISSTLEKTDIKLRDDRFSCSLSLEAINENTGFPDVCLMSLDYIKSKTDEENINALMLSFAFGPSPFEHLGFYIGGGLGLGVDSVELNAKAKTTEEENSLTDSLVLDFKVNTGVMFCVVPFMFKADVAFDYILGVTVGGSVGICWN